MGVDTILAIFPCVLSFVLFRFWTKHKPGWWLLLPVFLLFLPNAAYITTDVIHLVYTIKNGELPMWQIGLVVIPEYIVYILIGLEAHVVSLMNVDHHLRQIGRSRWIVPAELLLNLLCAIGIYFGRVQRLNSWYVVTQPERLFYDAVHDLSTRSTIGVVMVIFATLSLLYYLLKMQNAVVLFYIRQHQIRTQALPQNMS